jgi:hypothetical protein
MLSINEEEIKEVVKNVFSPRIEEEKDSFYENMFGLDDSKLKKPIEEILSQARSIKMNIVWNQPFIIYKSSYVGDSSCDTCYLIEYDEKIIDLALDSNLLIVVNDNVMSKEDIEKTVIYMLKRYENEEFNMNKYEFVDAIANKNVLSKKENVILDGRNNLFNFIKKNQVKKDSKKKMNEMYKKGLNYRNKRS